MASVLCTVKPKAKGDCKYYFCLTQWSRSSRLDRVSSAPPPPSNSSNNKGKTNIAVTALDGVINVNALFTLAIFIGLSFASPGQKSLSSRPSCQSRNVTPKLLVVFEVLSFSFFLLSSLVAQAIKLSLNLLNTAELADGFGAYVNLGLLKKGMMLTAMSSVIGCLFLMVSMLQVIEMKLGRLACGAKSAIVSVTFLVILVVSGLLIYILAAMYVFINATRPQKKDNIDDHSTAS